MVVVAERPLFRGDARGLAGVKFYLKVPQSVELRIDLRDSPYRLPSGKAPVFISQIQGTA